MTSDPNRVRASGPLAQHAVGFTQELFRQGYTRASAYPPFAVAGSAEPLAGSHGFGEHDLSEERVAQFLEARRAEGYSWTPPLSWVLELFSWVPGLGMAAAVPAPLTPLEAMVGEFAEYLMGERGLAAGTIRGYRALPSCSCPAGRGPMALSTCRRWAPKR